MQGPPSNRLGLGLRPPVASYGQGPPIGSLSSNASYGAGAQVVSSDGVPLQKLTTLFVGSISPGITDAILTSLLLACGSLRSFKRPLTAAGKPQGFGFAEFDEPDAVWRALNLLHGLQLPSLEPGAQSKKLSVTADAKTKAYLEAYESQRMKTDTDDAALQHAQNAISSIFATLSPNNPVNLDPDYDATPSSNNYSTQQSSNPPSMQPRPTSMNPLNPLNPNFVIPPHLQDLQESDLPENQRGLVISEIALFRERAAKRERDKAAAEREKGGAVAASRSAGVGGFSGVGAMGTVPSGPKERVWGRPAGGRDQHQQQQGWGRGAQGYSKPVGFVRGEDNESYNGRKPGENEKTDEELERDRKEARRREEDISFRDRERRYEPRERQRINGIERVMTRERATFDAQERDRIEIRDRLEVWDDDESDELFYTDRNRWRAQRARFLAQEQTADSASRALEARQAEHLRQESEAFLARQMAEMQSLAEEQRKAGLLLDDGAPVKLSISAAPPAAPTAPAEAKPAPKAAVFGAEEEEEMVSKRKGPLVKLDFGLVDAPETRKERLEKIRAGLSKEKDVLFKTKIRWEALSDQLIDTKIEKLTKRKMTDYLGQLDDDDLVMFVVEHLKDRKGPQKLIEGLEPVLVEEAEEFTILLWRQVVFESSTYAEGFETGDMLVD